MQFLFIITILLSVLLNSEETKYRENLVGIECSNHGPFLIDYLNKKAMIIAGPQNDNMYSLEYTDYNNEIVLILDYREYRLDPRLEMMTYVINKTTLDLTVIANAIAGESASGSSFEFPCFENTKSVIKNFDAVLLKIEQRESNKVIK